jgi:hypothetical protein
MSKTAKQYLGVNGRELTAKGAYGSFEEKLTLCQSLNLSFLTDECHLLCQ